MITKTYSVEAGKSISVGETYKAKYMINGAATPGGYFRVAQIEGGKVRFSILPEPDAEVTGGLFTMAVGYFCKLIQG